MKHRTLTEKEWHVMDVLWQNDGPELGQVVSALESDTGWSRNTVHTYLTRLEGKGAVRIDKTAVPHRYYPAVTREECSAAARNSLVDRVYHGSAGKLVAAFVQEGRLSREEREHLRRLLDEMEV